MQNAFQKIVSSSAAIKIVFRMSSSFPNHIAPVSCPKRQREAARVKKRPGANTGTSSTSALKMPRVSQADLSDARRFKVAGDPTMWRLDSFFRTAYSNYSALTASRCSRMFVREGISCLYSRIMGHGTGGKVVSKARMLGDRQCRNHGKVRNEIKALASIGIQVSTA